MNADRLLVKNCIEELEPQLPELSRLFYRELFHLDIRLKTVFPGNVASLNRKFFNMLATLKNVKHLEAISESVVKMGERHFAQYGVAVEHFPTLKQALLMALAAHLGERFSEDLKQAWSVVFDEVAAIMTMAADQQPAAPTQAAHDAPPTLDQIGGEEIVLQVHQRFYDVVFEHPWLGQFFYAKSKSALIKKQTQFMVAAFNGPNNYTGDTPAFVHMHMFITDEIADLREQLLRTAILEQGLSEDIADRWLKVDHSFRAGIVKKSIDECVMKCVGQFPITVKKPLYF